MSCGTSAASVANPTVDPSSDSEVAAPNPLLTPPVAGSRRALARDAFRISGFIVVAIDLNGVVGRFAEFGQPQTGVIGRRARQVREEDEGVAVSRGLEVVVADAAPHSVFCHEIDLFVMDHEHPTDSAAAPFAERFACPEVDVREIFRDGHVFDPVTRDDRRHFAAGETGRADAVFPFVEVAFFVRVFAINFLVDHPGAVLISPDEVAPGRDLGDAAGFPVDHVDAGFFTRFAEAVALHEDPRQRPERDVAVTRRRGLRNRTRESAGCGPGLPPGARRDCFVRGLK